jgi:hypothetical protein
MMVKCDGEKTLYEKSPAKQWTKNEWKSIEQMRVIFWMLKIHPRKKEDRKHTEGCR